MQKQKQLIRLVLMVVIGVAGITPVRQALNQSSTTAPASDRVVKTANNHAASGAIADVNLKSVTGNSLPAYKMGQEAIVLNEGVPTFKVGNTSTPYVHNQLLDHNRPGQMNSVLTKANRFYQTRDKVADPHSGRNTNPAGWHTIKLSNGKYLYNRSHLLGYAMGNFSGFDYSEYNKQNVVTGTEAFNQNADWGMNHWEGIVRSALDDNKIVRYQVDPLYKSGDLIPRAVHMQAISTDKTVEFNVVVYNVEPGVGTINYQTGSFR